MPNYSENYQTTSDPPPTCISCRALTVNDDAPYYDRINNGPIATLPNGTPLFKKHGPVAMMQNYQTHIGGGESLQNHTIMAINDTNCSNLKKFSKCTS